MASKTASLSSLDLSALHVPLPVGRDRTEDTQRIPPHPVKADRRPPQRVEAFDLAPAPRRKEDLIPYSIRIPLSMKRRLRELEKQDYVVSELLRNFIATGLNAMGVKDSAE